MDKGFPLEWRLPTGESQVGSSRTGKRPVRWMEASVAGDYRRVELSHQLEDV